MPKAPPPSVDLGAALLHAFATNERVNQHLLEHLDEAVWRAEPSGGKGRTIAAIVAHLHNVRHMWLTVSAKGAAIPVKLDRHTVTIPEASAGLRASADAMRALLSASLSAGGHVRDFKPDVVGFLAYAISHEAHHRGQICLLARQLGHPLPKEAQLGMWEWAKRAQETAG